MTYKSVALFSEFHNADADYEETPDDQQPLSSDIMIPLKGMSRSGEPLEGSETIALRVKSDDAEAVVRVDSDGIWVQRGQLMIWIHVDGKVNIWPRSDLPLHESSMVVVRPDGECELVR